MKQKTNEQVFKSAIKNLSGFEIAIMRERLVMSCKNVLENKEDVIKSMQENPFITGELWVASIQNIYDIIKLD